MAVWRASSREEAPISTGTFLVYDASGRQMRLMFSSADDNRFGTSIELADDDGMFGLGESSSTQGDVVDARLRTAGGGIFEVGSLGPLWVPPSQVREGGNAHGMRVDEVRRWEDWEVGVVTDSNLLELGFR